VDERLIAFCGLDCAECPSYIGTQRGDQELLQETAERWSTEEHRIEPDDILCDGCNTAGERLNCFCAECPVRVCAVGKGVANCGLCDDYLCEKLLGVWALIKTPEARDRLDELNKAKNKT
jgi:hypothetical protein